MMTIGGILKRFASALLHSTPSPAKRRLSRQVDTMDTAGKRASQSAVNRAIAAYKDLNSPGYALLVTGEWGVGKTFQVKHALDEGEYYYVSLFGLAKAPELHAAVFAAMSPLKSGILKRTEAARGTSYTGIPIGLVASELVGAFIKQEVKTDRIIIFDDLERCGIPNTDLLGAINLYVEHRECRVIIIAHDKKLTKELGLQAEKVVGQSVLVIPDVDDAYDAFLRKYTSEIRQTDLLTIKNDLINIFLESGHSSLRTLRRVMDDVTKMRENLSDKQMSNAKSTRAITRLFAAWSLEIRSGVKADCLLGRQQAEIEHAVLAHDSSSGPEIVEPAVVSSQRRYKSVRLSDSAIPDQVLYEIFENDDYSSLQEALEKSPAFASPADVAPWRILIDFQQLDDETASSALAAVLHQLTYRHPLKIGEFLHISALLLMLSHMGVTGKTIAEIELECIAYIDDAVAKGILEPSPIRSELISLNENAYDHIMYWIDDTNRDPFNRVHSYLQNSRDALRDRSLPLRGKDLLSLISHDGQSFFSKVVVTNSGEHEYSEVPILAKIDPADFVSHWMASHPRNWYWIAEALCQRHRHHNPSLSQEEPWLIAVMSLLEREMTNLAGTIRCVNISRIVDKIGSIPSVVRLRGVTESAQDEESDR